MLAAIKRGVKPPPCKGKEACDEYCSTPANMEVCMTFAIEAGFMSAEEQADAQKMLEAIKKGAIPPSCRGKEECDVYCSQEEHIEECMEFAIAAGFMSAEDAEMARKTGGKGPGGCMGKEECEAFCNNPTNQQTCFDFAKEHGLISEEELQRMGPGPDGQPGMIPGEMMPAGQTGPGGCTTPEECQTYCQNNPEACANFQPPTMSPPPGGTSTGPGGCSSPEECQAYCQSNPAACQNFGPQPGETAPPPGEYQPPQYQQPPEGTYPPPEGSYPPPEAAPSPSGLLNPNSLLGSILYFFYRLLNR